MPRQAARAQVRSRASGGAHSVRPCRRASWLRDDTTLLHAVEQYFAVDCRVAGIGDRHVGFSHSRRRGVVGSMPRTSVTDDGAAGRYRSDGQGADLHGCKRRVTNSYDVGLGVSGGPSKELLAVVLLSWVGVAAGRCAWGIEDFPRGQSRATSAGLVVAIREASSVVRDGSVGVGQSVRESESGRRLAAELETAHRRWANHAHAGDVRAVDLGQPRIGRLGEDRDAVPIRAQGRAPAPRRSPVPMPTSSSDVPGNRSAIASISSPG